MRCKQLDNMTRSWIMTFWRYNLNCLKFQNWSIFSMHQFLYGGKNLKNLTFWRPHTKSSKCQKFENWCSVEMHFDKTSIFKCLLFGWVGNGRQTVSWHIFVIMMNCCISSKRQPTCLIYASVVLCKIPGLG